MLKPNPPGQLAASSAAAEQAQLALLSTAERQLAECTDWAEILEIRDEAEAIRSYMKARHMSGKVQNQAARLKLLAERKMGAALTALKLRGGDRKSNSPRESLILKELGINRNASSRWQKEAAASTEVFETYCCQKIEKDDGDISTRGFLRYLREAAHPGPPQPAAIRRRRKSSAKHASVQPNYTICPEDIQQQRERWDELENHLATLTRLIECVIERCADRLERVEQREIPRYLQQTVAIVAELKRTGSLRRPLA